MVTSTFTLHGRCGTCGTGLALVARLGALWSPGAPRHFAWQAWHLATRHTPSLCVAGVALGDIHLHLAWQAWHLRHWAGSGGVLGRGWARLVAGDAVKLCVAGVALGDIHLCFAWQVWHLVTSTFVFRGVAGVALGVIHLRFAWQAWHLVTSTFVLRGRCGTCGTLRHWAGSGGALGRG